MTQKDYRLIAEVIFKQRESSNVATVILRQLVSKLCLAFAEDNPRFNEDIFRRACGV